MRRFIISIVAVAFVMGAVSVPLDAITIECAVTCVPNTTCANCTIQGLESPVGSGKIVWVWVRCDYRSATFASCQTPYVYMRPFCTQTTTSANCTNCRAWDKQKDCIDGFGGASWDVNNIKICE